MNSFRLEEVLPASMPCCHRLGPEVALRLGLVCEIFTLMTDVLEFHLGWTIAMVAQNAALHRELVAVHMHEGTACRPAGSVPRQAF